jgi:hypothetical protein
MSQQKTSDLFDNPVGYRPTFGWFSGPAIPRLNATFWGCEIAFFCGSCLTTEVIKQRYWFILVFS